MSYYNTPDLPYTTTTINGQIRIRTDESGFGAQLPRTVMDSLRAMVEKNGEVAAIVSCKDEVYTYKQYYDECCCFARALIKCGFKRYESLDIIGFNSPEWAFGYMGAIFAGGVGCGIYSTNSPQSCLYCAKLSDCSFVLVDGEKQLKKYISLKNEFKCKGLIIYNHEGVAKPDLGYPVYYFEEFMRIGRNEPSAELDKVMETIKPNQCCSIIFTSGTTGNPKAVLISHDNLTFTARSAIYTLLGMSHEDEFEYFRKLFYPSIHFVSYLPLSHIAAQLVDLHLMLQINITLYFAKPDALKGSLIQTIQKAKPFVQLGVPRVWEKMKEAITKQISEMNYVTRKLTEWAKSKGHIEAHNMQYKNTIKSNCCYSLAKTLVLDKLHKKLGLDKLRQGVSSGAPLAKEVVQFFADFGIPVCELLGQSEGTGPITINFINKWRIGKCGYAMAGIHLKIVESTGEIVFTGRNVCMGYKNDENANKETIDNEGYVHTGDIGTIDEDGFLEVTGRLKDIIITAGGENVAPVYIEDKLKDLMPIISNCVVIGDQKKFLSVLFTLKSVPDAEGEGTDQLSKECLQVAKQIGSTATSVNEAIKCPKFAEYITRGIDKYNHDFSISQAQNIRKYVILDRDFGMNTGEVTPTMKLKRKAIYAAFAKEIESMYDTQPIKQ